MIRWLVGIAALLSTLAAAALSTDTTAPDIPEPGSVEAIAKATGDPRFLSPWVSYLPQAHGVPSPLAFFAASPAAPVNSLTLRKRTPTAVPLPQRHLAFAF